MITVGVVSNFSGWPSPATQSAQTGAVVQCKPDSVSSPTGIRIEYANHLVAEGFYHSKIIITPDNQAAYINDPRFQNIDANGNRFATIGAGPNSMDHLEAGINRPRDVSAPSAFRQKLDVPCNYANEDEAIKRLFELASNYNNNHVWYTLLPQRVFGFPTGFNSNSFISGLGQAAGFAMPASGQTGTKTPGYENPIPAFRFGVR